MKTDHKVRIALVVAALFMVLIIKSAIKLANAQTPEQSRPPAKTLSQQLKAPPIVSIDEFDYKNDEDIKKAWITIASEGAKVGLTASLEVSTDLGFESSSSLKITTNVPQAVPRHEQVMYLFPPQNWTTYGDYIEIWVKGDGVEQEPWGGEFSISIIDGGSKEDEIWQSTRWIDRKNEWKKIRISLTGTGQGNPWQHAEDFVIPEWEKVRNGVMDKDKIKGVVIKSLTTEESASKCPELIVWVDHLVRY